MLNIALRNKITHPELRLLYDAKMRLSHPSFRNGLVSEVRKLRKKYKVEAVNPLEAKLKQFGNSGGWYKAKIEHLVKALYENKGVPAEFVGHWRSIEFELIFKSAEAQKDFAHEARCKGLGKFVTIKGDGSVKCNGDDKIGCPAEVVLSYKAGNEDVVRDFCQILRGKAYVNNTCGTHVHFDFRHVSPEDATLYGKRLARCVPALKQLLPKSRRDNHFCKEVINDTAGRGNRYAFVNLSAFSKYKTIEVRGHSGTIKADKILNWISLCERIMATDINFLPKITNLGTVNTIDELIAQYNFDKETTEYIKSRFNTFNVTAMVEEGEDKPEELKPLHVRAAANMPPPRDVPREEAAG